MSNTEIYKTARQNLLNKRQQMGYVQLITDCWGLLVEYEKEWHKQKGGVTAINNLFPNYEAENTMHFAMKELGLTPNSLAETLGWDALDADTDWVDGDVAIITPIEQGIMRFGIWFYWDGNWEISGKEKDGITKLRQKGDVLSSRYHFRKREITQ